MAHELADRRDVDFVVFEQLECEKILSNPRFEDLDKKTLKRVITEARKLAVKEILPLILQEIGKVSGLKIAR